MNKKIIVTIISTSVIVLGLVLFVNFDSLDHKILEQTFEINAVYFENNSYAEIRFQDKSGKTNHVILEILGMAESFHKEYESSTFVEKIHFQSVPQYGWQSVPITLIVEHEKLGKIGIKTEIRPVGETMAPLIFSKL
ncbi:MAG: hypothetical protein FJ356_03140 [Thaumarchaeota archaeon]|nr:hypothetical protein [Nitrososphaerota archaeon]